MTQSRTEINRALSALSRIIFILFLVLISNYAHTQNSLLNLNETSGKTTAWMKANLSLNGLQAARVEDINVEYEKRSLVLITGVLHKKQLDQVARANEQKRDDELKKILTPEQFSIWQLRKKETEETYKTL